MRQTQANTRRLGAACIRAHDPNVAEREPKLRRGRERRSDRPSPCEMARRAYLAGPCQAAEGGLKVVSVWCEASFGSSCIKLLIGTPG